jgi:hypothetical protein
VVQEGGDLCNREDENKVEEELERRDPLLALGRSLQKLASGQFVEHVASPFEPATSFVVIEPA